MMKLNKINNKFNLIFFMIMILSLFYVNATLVDSEDFESYIIDGTYIIDQTNEWVCNGGTEAGNCSFQTGTNPYDSSDNILKEDLDGNNYLQISASGFLWNNYRGSIMYLNVSGEQPISNYSNANYTVEWDMRLIAYEDGLINGTGNGMAYAGLSLEYGTQTNHMIGRRPTGAEGIEQLALSYFTSGDPTPPHTSLSNNAVPYYNDTNCSLPQDSNWHGYSVVHFMNASAGWKKTKITMYMDGEKCYEKVITTADTYFSYNPFFQKVYLYSVGGYTVDFDNIKIYADESVVADVPEQHNETLITNCTTSCSTWTKPFYLYEEFNGSINECGWATLENVCFDDELERELSDDYYSAFKETDSLSETNSRYATVSFDLKPISVNTNGYIALSVYDEDYTRFIQFFLSDDNKFYNNEGGASELVYSNVTNNTYKTVELHIDFTNNDFDLWYDDVKVATSLGLSVNFFDATNIGGIRISSSGISYNIDNVAVFSTDQNNEILPTDTEITTPINEAESMCGLFIKTDVDCSVDSDCVTDDCKPNGKCNHFDMTYCDENGYSRGNKCFVNAVTYCTLNSTQEIILDNFLLFLVFIIIIIGIVYIIFLVKS